MKIMKISYECSELIEELKADIEEFGDIDMYAIFEKIEEITCTDYKFNENGETEYWDSIVEDLVLMYDDLKDEYESLLERYQDRYYK